MYEPKKRISAGWIAMLVVLALTVLLLLTGPVRARLAADIERQSSQSVRDAVLRYAVQCYSVEGAYPSSIEYLEEHYGLEINHDRYIVSYQAFASNIMPEVRVLPKGDDADEA